MSPYERSVKALGDFIKSQRSLAQLSLRRLADASGISNAYLSQIERGIYKPSADVLRAIADALDISKDSLYRQAGILDPEDTPEDAVDVEEAIRLDPKLTDEQKETLLRVYRGFTGDS
jgi:transcriptional regulator with XRE-family HTH domain